MGRQKIVELRGHHLCCLLTYVGRGYNDRFTANISRIASLIGNGAAVVKIVRGPDDICGRNSQAVCPHFGSCSHEGINIRDIRAFRVFNGLTPPASKWFWGKEKRLDAATVWLFRRARSQGAFGGVCEGCRWESFCHNVALGGFAEARMFPSIVRYGPKHGGSVLCAT